MKNFSNALHSIYEAALVPEKWPEALLRVAAFFESDCALIMFVSRDAPVDIIHSPGVEHISKVYFDEEWWRHDIRAHRAPMLLASGVDVFNDQMVATPAEIETHPIYAQYIPKTGLGWCMIASIMPDFDIPVLLAIHRDKHKGPFLDSRQMELLGAFSRHVEQALRISLRLSNLQSHEATLLSAWDALDIGIFAVDADGRAVLANRYGRQHFDSIFAQLDRHSWSAARRHMLTSGSTASRSDEKHPSPQIVKSRDGHRLVIWSIPIAREAQDRIGFTESATDLLLVLPLEKAGFIDPAVIRNVFGLSLSEARLASLVGGGTGIREAAEKLRITEGTARVVLQKVFQKLSVNRQAELVLQLSRIEVIAGRDRQT
ncbi:helix-turn-helix transcriptional regulator [Ancylobacter terrae]|uniref:helix-turn-helix transcriptional regulator n=1 Tax=Ancylobacter sp. sgz301288 TaxID=3342077 RepID=UPI00385B5ADA